MGVPLPGFDSIEDVIKHVRATQPQGYETRAATVFRYLDGAWQEDTRSALARVFPLSHQKMQPIGLPLIERVSETKATAFDGDPSFDLVADDGTEVETAADGVTTWESVVEDANVLDVLRRADERTVAGRLVFLRVGWDTDTGRVRIDRFDPQLVFPIYDVDTPTMASASMVVLELTPDVWNGKPRKRYEVWTAVVNDLGQTEDARAFIVDERGDLLADVGVDGANPYVAPNGPVPEGEPTYAVLPVVAFGDLADGPWPEPRESLVDAQRAMNVRKTNLHHVEILQAHGQWISGRTSRDADSWSGAPSARGSEDSRLGRWRSAPSGGAQIPIGPDSIIDVPFGRDLANVPIQAQIANLRASDAAETKDVAVFEGIPVGRITGDAREVSGVALQVENAPLARYRQKRLATFRRPVEELLDLIRIVWNTHVEANRRFPLAWGRFTPDTPPVVVDPVAMLDRAERMKRSGLFTLAECRAAATGESVEDAAKFLEEHADELASATSASVAATRVFPSALAQARGATQPQPGPGQQPQPSESQPQPTPQG